MVLLNNKKYIFIFVSLLVILLIFFSKKFQVENKKILYAPIDSQYKVIEKVDNNGNAIIDNSKYNDLFLIINNKEYILKNNNEILEKGKYIYNKNNIRFISYKKYASVWECNILENENFSSCDKYSNEFFIKK